MERPESLIVPARRSQWLVSALAYAFGLDQGIENEVVVLATGIDQYIQEIFHHLDVHGRDRVSAADFRLLCEVIGFPDCGESPATEGEPPAGTAGQTSPAEDRDAEPPPPPTEEMTFKEFHARLVQCFVGDDAGESPVGACQERRWDSGGKLVEAEVRVLPRNGLSIRTMCTECFQKRPVTEIYHSVMFKQGKDQYHGDAADDLPEAPDQTGSDSEDDGRQSPTTTPERPQGRLAGTQQPDVVDKLRQENEGLREIIEDMRQALQSSDARQLALLVSLRKLQADSAEDSSSEGEPRGGRAFLLPTLPPKLPGHSSIRPQNAVALARELNRLRADRDRQLEEAVVYAQSLEADLWRTRRDQSDLERTRSALLSQQRSLTERLCSARETLSGGLERVRELEKQIEGIDDARIQAKELGQWSKHNRNGRKRSENSTASSEASVVTGTGSDADAGGASEDSGRCSSEDSGGASEDATGSSEDSGGDHMTGMDSGCVSDSERGSPTSAGSEADSSSLGSGCISDEESAWQEEANINNNNNCANSALTGGLNNADWLIKLTQVQKHLLQTEVEKGQAEGKFKKIRADLMEELSAKLRENEDYQTEIQTLESERVRLSVIESTVGEVISLLRKLRNLNLSRRSAGKILMDTLEVCLQDNYRSDSENEVRNFLNFLHKQLMHHDLLRLSGARSEVRCSQSTPCSPVTRRSNAVSSGSRSIRLSTDFYQFGNLPKKVRRSTGESPAAAAAAAAAPSSEVEDMVCNGNGDSPTRDDV